MALGNLRQGWFFKAYTVNYTLLAGFACSPAAFTKPWDHLLAEPCTKIYLIVAFALPEGIERGLAVDGRAAVPVGVAPVALVGVCSALDRVRSLVDDEKLFLK